jgi:HSP20 family protein
MDEKERKELKAKEKAEVSTPAEQTRPGPIFTPAMDIFETDQQITVLADMPGVKAQDLAIDLRENTLTLSGNVESPEGEREEELLREYRTGNYYRQFTLSEGIDQSKIEAALKDGVLRLRLPKVEAAAPRTIPVKTG